VKSVEPRVEVGDEELRWEGGEESLSVASHVGRDLGALAKTDLWKREGTRTRGQLLGFSFSLLAMRSCAER